MRFRRRVTSAARYWRRRRQPAQRWPARYRGWRRRHGLPGWWRFSLGAPLCRADIGDHGVGGSDQIPAGPAPRPSRLRAAPVPLQRRGVDHGRQRPPVAPAARCRQHVAGGAFGRSPVGAVHLGEAQCRRSALSNSFDGTALLREIAAAARARVLKICAGSARAAAAGRRPPRRTSRRAGRSYLRISCSTPARR